MSSKYERTADGKALDGRSHEPRRERGIYLQLGTEQVEEESLRCEEEEAVSRDAARVKSSDIVRHTDLVVFQRAFAAAMALFKASKSFPREENRSLTDQIRRSSRSVAANIGEGWRKRRYPASFVSKLNDAEGEAGETQVWLQFAVECEYLSAAQARPLYSDYDGIIRMLLHMQNHSADWALTKR